jgi:hypothetical protein
VTVTRSGSVTRAGSSTLSKSVKVTAGRITADSLRVHSAVTFAVAVGAYNGTTQQAGYTAPAAAVATIAASDRSEVTRITYPAKPVTVGVDTTWSAYPSPGGYDAWIGTCSPLVTHADSEPGTTPRAVLQLSPVVVHLSGANTGDAYKTQARSVSATWAGGGCSEQLSFSATTSSTCSPNASSGQCLLHLAVPPGTWTFKIDGLTYSTTATVGVRVPSTVAINTS